jgi:glycosyltransferase involved in cell wall biosynthesis
VSAPAKPALLVVFYANPDRYPPTYNAIRLLSERFRVHVICRANADPPGVTWPADVRVDRVGPAVADRDKFTASMSAKLGEYVGFVWAVRRALAADRPALAYAYEPHAVTALGLAGCRARVVYHRHEIEDLGPADRRSLQGWILALSWRFGKRADLLVFPEQHRARMYQEFVGDPREPLVVPNFPLLSAFAPITDWPAILEARWREKVLLYRGAIGAYNGILQMVRALPDVDAAVTLRLCGGAEPAFLGELRALAAEVGVVGRLRYDGYVPYDRLNRETVGAAAGLVLYQRVQANLEFNATATNKLYEYAACGVPVVVPDRPAFRAFLAGESWVEYAEAAEPASVASAVGRLFAHRGAYEERCRAARRAFEERFNYEAVFAPLRERVLALAGG